MDNIEKVEKQELAWNGRRVKSTEDEIIRILTPMFVLFPQTKADKNTVAVYVMMLRDVAPDVLAGAVLRAMNTCKFLPTVAEIREQIDAMRRPPGPHSVVDPATLPPAPPSGYKMFRLDDEEDRQQRMERLRQTKGWSKYYA